MSDAGRTDPLPDDLGPDDPQPDDLGPDDPLPDEPTGEGEGGYVAAAGDLASHLLSDALLRGAMLLSVLVFGAGLAADMPWQLIGPVAGLAGFGLALWLMPPHRTRSTVWLLLTTLYAVGLLLLLLIWG